MISLLLIPTAVVALPLAWYRPRDIRSAINHGPTTVDLPSVDACAWSGGKAHDGIATAFIKPVRLCDGGNDCDRNVFAGNDEWYCLAHASGSETQRAVLGWKAHRKAPWLPALDEYEAGVLDVGDAPSTPRRR